MRPTDVEIRQYAARKRPASGAGPSRLPKKPTPAVPTVEASTIDQSEPVIALAAPAAQPEERPAEEAAEGTSAVSPAGVAPDDDQEPEHQPTASAATTGGAASNSSIPSLPVPPVGVADRGKAPMDPADDTRSGSRTVPPSAQFPEELDLSGIVPSGAEDQATEEMADPSSGGIAVAEEAVQEQVAKGETAATRDPLPTASPLPTNDPASTVDPVSIAVDTPVIPDLPSVEEIDSEG
uniref:Vegetative cell wall protein gp1-like n=1 Tax=Elaeis guineensis var. tenera TaxID=51953 RepID=A0A6I9SC43_ELAGV|nr:vegetative cell wall protein gp1-like [Elaeis guineensis]